MHCFALAAIDTLFESVMIDFIPLLLPAHRIPSPLVPQITPSLRFRSSLNAHRALHSRNARFQRTHTRLQRTRHGRLGRHTVITHQTRYRLHPTAHRTSDLCASTRVDGRTGRDVRGHGGVDVDFDAGVGGFVHARDHDETGGGGAGAGDCELICFLRQLPSITFLSSHQEII